MSKTKILATMSEKDEHGVHFTERYSFDLLNEMEKDGLIRIIRPEHPTGMLYSPQYWELELTSAGVALAETWED